MWVGKAGKLVGSRVHAEKITNHEKHWNLRDILFDKGFVAGTKNELCLANLAVQNGGMETR